MLTLGIDTSNYATSLAVFDADAGEVVCDCKKFLPVKAGQLGLRQSDALFHHTAALPELMQKINDTVPLSKIQAVAVSEKPRPVQGSYMPCFLAGDKTLFERETLVFHVSGGTTDLLLCRGAQSIIPLGTSSDLYAGQAVDRLGVKLGFAFPAGVYVSEQAALCEERIKPKVSVRGTACSLSGLENQCAKLLEQGKTAPYVCKYCLLCVAETLLRMAQNALQEHPGLPVVFAGGVMSSDLIRSYITARLPDARFVPAKFASDNAIGIAVLAAKECGVWQTL